LANQQTALEYLETALRYLSATAEQLTHDDLREAVETAVSGRQGDNLMPTLAEKWMQEGIKEGIKEGIQQGLYEGRQEAMRETVSDLLFLRFNHIPAPIAQALQAVRDLDDLRFLHRRAATVDTLEEFERALATISEK
jgi:flagellar biosynthesis/type III secretory pathway protein FliH